MHRIVLAYSGGPRSSAAISWLAETYRAEVVALTLDIGQGGDLEDVRDRALALGAIRAHVLDVRDEFAWHYLVPALKADALYEGNRSRAHALSHPLIAQKLVEIAAIEQTATVAHGSAAADPRIGVAVRALDPAIEVVALATSLRGSIDSPSSGSIDSPRTDVGAKSPGECPNEPAFVEITFSRGVPTAINAIAMPLVDLVGSLDIIAGAHGVGRRHGLESPAALVLHNAHRDLQTLTITGEADDFSRRVSRQLADIIERGSWFTPLRESLEAYVDRIQGGVGGVIRLRLFKGDCAIVDRRTARPDAVMAPARKLTFTATAKA
ncbi:MAG TPA: argininosuccinate synthase domain-containing protein [Vicinamibacterales bacterium]|nr:argininosuccinate synthase domain-containing protein [Vicinamibacterales bacterium]